MTIRDQLIDAAMRGTRVALRTRYGEEQSVAVGYVTGITKGGCAMVQNCGQLVPVRLEQILELREVQEPPGELGLDDE